MHARNEVAAQQNSIQLSSYHGSVQLSNTLYTSSSNCSVLRQGKA
jgi:hypothetical protein